jgi:hypothetical protein
MEHVVKILSIKMVTHDVKQYRIEKPQNYRFIPGQATEVSINLPEWREEKRPFTFTCLNDQPFLEFTIKSYRDHDGVTHQLDKLKVGDELIIRDVWGAISYEGEGYFLAGGAGITPFIAILRELYSKKQMGNNKLFFSNKTKDDIILKEELQEMLGPNVVFILTHESPEKEKGKRINREFLLENVGSFDKHFYICGPDKMVADLNEVLVQLGAKAESVVFEK